MLPSPVFYPNFILNACIGPFIVPKHRFASINQVWRPTKNKWYEIWMELHAEWVLGPFSFFIPPHVLAMTRSDEDVSFLRSIPKFQWCAWRIPGWGMSSIPVAVTTFDRFSPTDVLYYYGSFIRKNLTIFVDTTWVEMASLKEFLREREVSVYTKQSTSFLVNSRSTYRNASNAFPTRQRRSKKNALHLPIGLSSRRLCRWKGKVSYNLFLYLFLTTNQVPECEYDGPSVSMTDQVWVWLTEYECERATMTKMGILRAWVWMWQCELSVSVVGVSLTVSHLGIPLFIPVLGGS